LLVSVRVRPLRCFHKPVIKCPGRSIYLPLSHTRPWLDCWSSTQCSSMPSASGINADVIIRASLSWLRLPLASAELLRFLAKDDARYLNNTALTRDRAPRSCLPVTQRTPTQIISPGPWINPQL
jgi:hypothetical protein